MTSGDQPTTHRETRAAELQAAEARGRAAAEIEARFGQHDREIGYLKTAQQTARQEMKRIGENVAALASNLTEHLAVSKAIQEQLEKERDNQLSRKTYVLGLVGAVIALGMLILAGLALLHAGASQNVGGKIK